MPFFMSYFTFVLKLVIIQMIYLLVASCIRGSRAEAARVLSGGG